MFVAAAAAPALSGAREADPRVALLATPDLSSPRATLQIFRASIERAYDVLAEAYEQHRGEPGLGTSPEVAEKVTTAELLLRRAMATLDLSQTPAVSRQHIGVETMLLIKEVLDRLPATPIDEVPDAADVRAASPPIADWLVPYSDIRIVRLEEGANAGQFVFSAATVARAREFYDAVRAFAERPDARADLFELYTLTPGNLLPPKWYLWIEELPEWTRQPLLGQTVWQWAGLVVALAVLFGGYWFVARRSRRAPKSPTPVRRFVGRVLRPLGLIAVVIAAIAVIAELNITAWLLVGLEVVLYSIAYLAAAWIAYLVSVGTAEWVISSPRIDPAGIDASLLRIAARVVGLAIGIAIVFYGATEIGLSIYGVIAGLGVGGLALGLAARPTLENLIGGLTLYADRTVKVGDFCQFGDKMGVVEEIGLRSTRIRAPDRTVITVSNADLSNMQIVNFTRRDRSLLRTMIGLRYETTPAQMQEVLERIRTLLLDHPAVVRNTVRVRFRELGSYALGVEVYAQVDRAAMNDFLEIQEGILLDIMRIIEECGTAIAFPSQTTYHVHENAGGRAQSSVEPAAT
ncbi:MAG: mechanosensitive ion channel domain-containing protein [Dongiaceae bacterium]